MVNSNICKYVFFPFPFLFSRCFSQLFFKGCSPMIQSGRKEKLKEKFLLKFHMNDGACYLPDQRLINGHMSAGVNKKGARVSLGNVGGISPGIAQDQGQPGSNICNPLETILGTASLCNTTYMVEGIRPGNSVQVPSNLCSRQGIDAGSWLVNADGGRLGRGNLGMHIGVSKELEDGINKGSSQFHNVPAMRGNDQDYMSDSSSNDNVDVPVPAVEHVAEHNHLSVDQSAATPHNSYKVGSFMHYKSLFISGFVIRFSGVRQISLVALSIFPLIVISGRIYAYLATGLIARVRKSYFKAGEIAEEVIRNGRTVQMFMSEERAGTSYRTTLLKTYKFGKRSGLVKGLG